MDRNEFENGNMQHASRPEGHGCSLIINAILLGFFIHYLNYSTDNNITDCYADASTGSVCFDICAGLTNVSDQWRNLEIVGITFSSVAISSFVFILIKPLMPLGLLLSCSYGCIYFGWLITATIFRWNVTGQACAPFLAAEGKFLKNLTLSLWGIAAASCVLGCCAGILGAVCSNRG